MSYTEYRIMVRYAATGDLTYNAVGVKQYGQITRDPNRAADLPEVYHQRIGWDGEYVIIDAWVEERTISEWMLSPT